MSDNEMPFALRPGTLITGYEIVRAIGAGGFGITYEGFNPITERRVAIKEFFPRGIASRDDATRIAYSQADNEVVAWALKRFAESTNRLAKLKHPHIIEVLNYVADNGTGYMVMEHVDGITLEDWLRARATPPELVELGPIFDPIFDALEYVHSKNLIHRDIAPDNIMIRNDDGRPVLIDFGALKIIEEHTRAHGTAPKSFGVSKLNYSPPEQNEDGVAIDPRVDVYALAATIYRSLAGQPPVDSDKRKTDMALRAADSYIPLAQAAKVPVPPQFASGIDAAMSLRPEHRPSTIAEFRARLAQREDNATAIQTASPESPTAVAPVVAPAAANAPYVPSGSRPLHVPPSVPPGFSVAGTEEPQPVPAGGYVPPGASGPASKRSGIPLPGIIAIVLVALISIGVLLHRPILGLVDRMTSSKIVATDPDKPDPQPQPQPQKQTQPRPEPQPQPQKQTQPRPEPQPQPRPEPQPQPPPRVQAEAKEAYDRGVRFQRSNDYRQAIAEFTEAIRLDPNNANAYTNRGLSHYRLGDNNRAFDDYSAAIRLEPNAPRSSAPYLNRAIVYRARRDLDRALEDVNNAIRLDPRFALAFNTRANIHYDRRDYDRAIEDYNEATRIDPSYATAYANRGNAYYAKRDNRRAIDDYSTALRLEPNNVMALVGRGNAYDDLNDGDRAIADYTSAIRANRSYALAYFNRGRVYLARRDFISALSDYSDAVRLDPERAAAHQGRGLANEGLNRRDEAIKDFRQALRLDSNLQRSREALRRLGVQP